MTTKVAIGCGNVFRVHNKTYPVKIIGAIDTDTKKRNNVEEGIPFYTSWKEFASKKLKPDYFSINIPTENHVSVMEEILQNHPNTNIFVEKPICLPSQIHELEELTKEFPKAKVAVGENYMSSNVTQNVRKYIEEYNLREPTISIEFSKNRILDVEKGRFLDPELGAFGFEGPHMLTCVHGCGEDKKIAKINKSVLRDMILSDGTIKDKQGEAELDYETKDGSSIHFFTSMIGNSSAVLPNLDVLPKYNIKENLNERYRTINIYDKSIRIIGLYEPMPEHPRSKGMVLVTNNYVIEKAFVVDDNTMKLHQERAVKFFEGRGENPCTVETAVDIVKDLDKAVKFAKGI